MCNTRVSWRHCRFGSRPLKQSEYYNKASCNVFSRGGSCLKFMKNTASVKHTEAKCNKTRYGYTMANQ